MSKISKTHDAATPVGKLVILEGNISAGKSTLCRDLSRLLPNYRVFLEPTVENPFLDLFYSDPPRYALRMQMYLLRHRLCTYVAAIRHAVATGEGVVLDRSVFSDSVFAVRNARDGNISLEGLRYYAHVRSKMLGRLPHPHVALFLDVDPDVCHERVHGVRMRDCEASIPIAYLRGLHECYVEFMEGVAGAQGGVDAALRAELSANADGSAPAPAAPTAAKGSRTAAVTVPWNNFGSSAAVANLLTTSGEGDVAELAADAELLRWVYDDDAIIDAMTPDYICEEAGDYEDYSGESFRAAVSKALKAMGDSPSSKEMAEVEKVAARSKRVMGGVEGEHSAVDMTA